MSRKPKNDAGTLVVAFVIAVALISTAVDFLKQHIEIIVLFGACFISLFVILKILKRRKRMPKAKFANSNTNRISRTFEAESEPESLLKTDPESVPEAPCPTSFVINFPGFSDKPSNAEKRREGKGENIIKSLTDYVTIDLETTGLDPNEDEIIEFAAVRVVEGKVADTFSSLANPRRSIPEEITKLTGITNDMLSTAPDVADVLRDFLAFVGNNVVIGHNVSFDVNFLYDSCERHSFGPFTNDHVDTLRISRKCTEGSKNHKLDTLLKHYDIVNDNAHRALSDALCTQKLYEAMKGCIVGDKVLRRPPVFGAYTVEAIFRKFVDIIEPEENTVELKINKKNTFIRFFNENAFEIRLNTRSTTLITESPIAAGYISLIPGSESKNDSQFCFPVDMSIECFGVFNDLVKSIYVSKRPAL